MAKKQQAQRSIKVKIELSQWEASYIQGMLAAYKHRLELEKKGGDLIVEELKKAQSIEKKFIFA